MQLFYKNAKVTFIYKILQIYMTTGRIQLFLCKIIRF